MENWRRGSCLWQLGGALLAVWIGWTEGSGIWLRDRATAAPESSSPLPLPWEWVYSLQEEAGQRQCTLVGLLRSQPLPAPDPQWQVYTRLDLVATPQASRLTSVLFAENLRTQALHVIYQAAASVYDPVEPLDFAMILPLAWQDNTLLAREYTGWFQTDLSWDRAVIWPLPTGSSQIPPVQIWDPPPALAYAELLGWDAAAKGRVLFAVADSLGESPRLVSVGSDGQVLQRASAVAFPQSSSSLEGWQAVMAEPLCHQSRFGVEQKEENGE
ncbi:hypothetical protein [Synechococcus sp. H70.2]|uniref:hypothetical protein n=1 Tax=unclassified Synechococcus TaxID=2626047 RepID=UPI0039C279E6